MVFLPYTDSVSGLIITFHTKVHMHEYCGNEERKIQCILIKMSVYL